MCSTSQPSFVYKPVTSRTSSGFWRFFHHHNHMCTTQCTHTYNLSEIRVLSLVCVLSIIKWLWSVWLYISGMGIKIVEPTTTNSFGLKSVDRSGFIRFGVNGQRKSSKETLTDNKEKEEGDFVIKSMDRSLEKQKAESIRHTMQTQEDVFKQQVYIYTKTCKCCIYFGFDYSILCRVQFWFR